MHKLAVGMTVAAIALTGLGASPASNATAASNGYALVKGTVVKETGDPLANTNISVGVGDCETPGGCGADSVVTVKTDAGGHYHARVLVTSNPHVYVSVPPRGPYQGRASAYIKIATGKTYTKNLTVHKESMLAGKVVSTSGSPIAAVVIAYSVENNKLQDRDVTAAADGGYFHLSLPTGAYKIRISANTTPGKGGVITEWYGSPTKDGATIVRMKPGTDARAKIVFTP